MTGIFILTLLGIAVVVFVGLFLVAIAFGNSNPSNQSSILVKDNTLKYERKDKNGKNNKRSFSLKQLNKYLLKHKEIAIIDNLTLTKQYTDRPSNANNLILRNPKGESFSLKELYNEDPHKYNRVCNFLEKIADKDDLELDFRLRRYVNDYNNLTLLEENIIDFKELYKNTSDKDIKDKILKTVDELSECEEKIESIEKDDQLRKLNNYYLRMLKQIVEEYETLKKQDENSTETAQSKEKLIYVFDLINPVFDSLYDKQENNFDKLEAEVSSLQQLSLESKQLLEKIKE